MAGGVRSSVFAFLGCALVTLVGFGPTAETWSS